MSKVLPGLFWQNQSLCSSCTPGWPKSVRDRTTGKVARLTLRRSGPGAPRIPLTRLAHRTHRKGKIIVSSNLSSDPIPNLRPVTAGAPSAQPSSLLSSARAVMVVASLITLTGGSGCSLFRKPSQDPMTLSAPLQGSESAAVYQRIREAKSQNSIVLQIAGDSSPIRVLPLPPDGQSVFISDLLKQTGLQDKFGHLRATLYRATPAAPSGVPLEVRFDERSGEIRPEADYALQAGDRLKIAKQERPAFGGMFDQLLPSNGARALRGY